MLTADHPNVSIVHPSRADELAPARSTRTPLRRSSPAAPATASFASLHVAALKSTAKANTGGAVAPGTDAKATTPAATTPATVDRAATPVKLRRNESMEAVAGHSYAEINGGARDGMYVNTTSNKRRGEAFVLVHRNGIEYHIYGKGKDRLVVALKPQKPSATPVPTTPTPTPAPNTASSGGVTPTVSPTGTTGAKVGGLPS